MGVEELPEAARETVGCLASFVRVRLTERAPDRIEYEGESGLGLECVVSTLQRVMERGDSATKVGSRENGPVDGRPDQIPRAFVSM